MKNSFKYFSNTDCRYFPCHNGIDPERFNCLFCYCPLYFLGKHCGGDFEYTSRNVKCCTNCAVPHVPENYDRIVSRLKQSMADNCEE